MSGDRCVALLTEYGELRINGLGELEVVERTAPLAPLPEIEIDVPDPEPEPGAPREIVEPDAPPIPDHTGDPEPTAPEAPPEWRKPQVEHKIRTMTTEFPVAPRIMKRRSKLRCPNCRGGYQHDQFFNRGHIAPRTVRGGEVMDISKSSGLQHALLAQQTELFFKPMSFIGSHSLDALEIGRERRISATEMARRIAARKPEAPVLRVEQDAA